jgi:hypothetical protein
LPSLNKQSREILNDSAGVASLAAGESYMPYEVYHFVWTRSVKRRAQCVAEAIEAGLTNVSKLPPRGKSWAGK